MTEQALTFLWTVPTLLFGIVLVVGCTVVSFLAWQRSGFGRGVGMLESLRMLLVILVVATLNQPEWFEEYRPQQQPTLAVLWDESKSMATRDVIDPDRTNAKPQTRSDSIQSLIEQSTWAAVSGTLNVVIEPFSSTLDPPESGSDLNQALSNVLERHANLRGVVLISDGDWNAGDPPINAATKLRMKDVPVFAIGVGSITRLPDVELVSLDVPTFGVANKPMRIPFLIESSMSRERDVTLTLRSDDGKTVTKEVRIPAMGRLHDTITWKPDAIGEQKLTLEVPFNDRELLEENNSLTVPVNIRKEQLKVLLVESYPRWEYRYLRNALERDPGVEVSCLLFHPDLDALGGGRGYIKSFPESQELTGFDVVFLGDVGVEPGQLTLEQCHLIKQLIRNQASGLVFMPGFRGKQMSLLQSELAELYPVVMDETQPRGWGSQIPGEFELTETGRRSLLTKLDEQEDGNVEVWQNLPGFQWYAAILRAKAGSEVLATHKTESTRFGRVPLIVTKTFGTGKILFMGTDGAWRWREGVEDKYHYRFWGQVARWMAYQRNMAQGQSMRLFYSPDRPRTEDVVTLNANVMSEAGEPLQQGTVIVKITSPSGRIDTVRLLPGGQDSWGLFNSSFTPKEAGEYILTLMCRENGSTLETKLSVQGLSRERLGRPAQYGILEEIAAVSRGRIVKQGELQGLMSEIASLPEPEPLVRRLRIWCHPLWAGLIILLMGVFWVGRKAVGAI